MIKKFLLLVAMMSAPAWAHESACVQANDDKPAIMVVGDSLSAAYGIALEDGWVALLQDRLEHEGYEYRVINASVSGDTTSGGLVRLRAALKNQRPALVVVELGANDGLRGLPLRNMRNNLAAMIEAAQETGAQVALLGIHIPSNYGPRYTKSFNAIYPQLAQKYAVGLVDFFLDGVALDRSLMLDDGLHPNAKAQPRLLDNAWTVIEPLLQASCAAN